MSMQRLIYLALNYNIKEIEMESKKEPVKKKRVRVYSLEQRQKEAARRKQQHQMPLERLVRNSTARAFTSWNRGLYGQLDMLSCGEQIPSRKGNVPSRKGHVPSYMRPCTYYSVTGNVMLGYEIREVKTNWCVLVAVWGHEGVVCVPIQFVEEGHRENKLDPGHPPMCNQCDNVTYTVLKCVFCGAPLFRWPES